MKIHVTREWSESRLPAEHGHEIGAGCPAVAGSPVARLLEYDERKYLQFQPHGYEFPIQLPVITSGTRDESGCWTWNGSLEKPTLRPSIKTAHAGARFWPFPTGKISHLWLNDGMCQHLGDSTDGLAGQALPLLPLENTPVHPPQVGCDASSDHDSHDETTYNETL